MFVSIVFFLDDYKILGKEVEVVYEVIDLSFIMERFSRNNRKSIV